jgi:peptidoglycan/xylan/chitin deacetylase (PgdA/CDA1 family)
MHFYAEPGIQTSLYMDRGYYWQDEHYHNNRKFMDLYRCQNTKELFKLLKKKNIRVFVVTGLNTATLVDWTNHDPRTKHLLPKLLLDRDSAFEFDGVFAYLKD